MRVLYTNNDGYLQVREVPEGFRGDARSGVLIGPPDLATLPLSPEKCMELSNRLAKAGLVDHQTANNRRTAILEVIQAVTGNRDKQLMIAVLAIYQNEYFGGHDGEE